VSRPPTQLRSRPRGVGPRPIAALLAVALGGCSTLATDPVANLQDLAGSARRIRAQSPDEIPPAIPPATPAAPPPMAIEAMPAMPGPEKLTPGDPSATVGCTTCGGIGQVASGDGRGFRSCSSCGGSGCVPGRKACPPYEGHTFASRFFGELYQSLCCPDPCYEPGWVPAANAAFFVDSPRPRTIQRFRNDYAWNLQFPDRSEYFWARQQIQKTTSTNGQFTNIAGGRGPGRPNNFPKNKPFLGQPSLNYDEFSFYNEVAASPRASFFVDIPYRTVSPRDGGYHAGFSDMNVGTKGVILDTELLLLTLQFKTFIPIGNAGFGLGTGHVSLEPSLLGALKLGPDSYLQGQLSQWIPIGGDPNYQGGILHYHGSYNQVLCRVAQDSPIIGTLEANGWSFQDGAYTNPAVGPYVRSSGVTYFSIGPGIRASICNAVDFGGAIAFPVSSQHWADPILRLEFRILY
jgi:hypothetical protein